jgi:general secretion pathway protein G
MSPVNPTRNYARSRTQNGFTLIEIMVVVVILGMLATLVIQAVGDRPDQARDVKAKNDIATLESALKLYRLDNFTYPSAELGLNALVTKPTDLTTWRGPYIERLPKDPWGNDYRYRNPGLEGRKMDIYSYGADNAEGGTEAAADIGSWAL